VAAAVTTTATGGAPKGMLKAAMAGTEQPNITAALGEEEDDDDEVAAKAKSRSKVESTLAMTKGAKPAAA